MPPSAVVGLGGLPGFPTPSRYNHMTVMQPPSAEPLHYNQTMAPMAPIRRKTATRPSASKGKAMPVVAMPTVINPAVTPMAPCKDCPPPLTSINPSIGDGGPPRVRTSTGSNLSKPLFVDCSVEYELPMVPKIPSDSQPLLVIHPGWSQKRRVTRSSSQQRMLAEEQQRAALLHQHQHHYLQYMTSMPCSQCPPGVPMVGTTSGMPPAASTQVTSTSSSGTSTTSRKRSYQASTAGAVQMPPPAMHQSLSRNMVAPQSRMVHPGTATQQPQRPQPLPAQRRPLPPVSGK